MNNHVAFPTYCEPPGYPNQILLPWTISHTPGMMDYNSHSLGTVNQRNPEDTGQSRSRDVILKEGKVFGPLFLQERRDTWSCYVLHFLCEINVYLFGAFYVGAIQILIGLVHFGFGIVLMKLSAHIFLYILASGYLYWGGIFFIISGSLTVAAEHKPTSCLIKGSLGMNILSSFVAGVGIIVFILDMVIVTNYFYDYEMVRYQKLAKALSDVILIFAILEFFIGIVSSVSGWETVHSQAVEATHFMSEDDRARHGGLLPVPPPPPYEAHVNLGYDSPSQTE